MRKKQKSGKEQDTMQQLKRAIAAGWELEKVHHFLNRFEELVRGLRHRAEFARALQRREEGEAWKGGAGAATPSKLPGKSAQRKHIRRLRNGSASRGPT
jgi:hypothetical protein